jgi:hypothetical protein
MSRPPRPNQPVFPGTKEAGAAGGNATRPEVLRIPRWYPVDKSRIRTNPARPAAAGGRELRCGLARLSRDATRRRTGPFRFATLSAGGSRIRTLGSSRKGSAGSRGLTQSVIQLRQPSYHGRSHHHITAREYRLCLPRSAMSLAGYARSVARLIANPLCAATVWIGNAVPIRLRPAGGHRGSA